MARQIRITEMVITRTGGAATATVFINCAEAI
jgi:hypothetical protein